MASPEAEATAVDTEAADGGMQAVDDSGAASPASDEAATDAVDVGPASLGTLANPLPKLKMPLSAYMLFAGAKRAEVREANPTKSVAQQAEVLGALWRSLTDEEKKPYVELNKEKKKEYADEMARRKRLGLITQDDAAHKQHEDAVRAANADVPALPKLKRPVTAYFDYMSTVRLEVKSENPGLGLGGLQKIIAARWNALSDEEKKPFYDKHATAMEAYRNEMERRKRLGLRTEGDMPKKRNRDNPLETSLPLARVKKIMKMDPDLGNITKSALQLTCVATEAMVSSLVREARKVAGPRHTLRIVELTRAIRQNRCFEFLRRDFRMDALEKKAKKSQRKAAHGAAAVGTRSITSFFGGGKGNGKGKGKTKTATQAAADA